jgi:hypothetical protein
MSKEIITTGYKVTDSEMKCRGYQYALNKRFKEKGKLSICNNGFHFCEKVNHCFNYYDFDRNNRVFEIKAFDEIETYGDKSCCLEIELVRELSWEEVLKLANTGMDNTGHSNSGNWNSGNWNSGNSNSGNSNSGDSNSGNSNSGNWNSGNWNSGNWNSGDSNSGNWNSGNWNSGNWNSGNWNSGNSNSGDSNSGNWNSGNSNSGNSNSGDSNSGNSNSGNSNSGDSNSGNWNSGNWNSGDSNSGNWNSGNRNSGDSNSGYRNSGAFCLDNNPVLYLFDKPTKIKVRDWENHKAVQIMNEFLNQTIWVPQNIMTDEEKKSHPKHETTEGYLKTITLKEAWGNMWYQLSNENKNVFLTLPNFDKNIFEQITGIKL